MMMFLCMLLLTSLLMVDSFRIQHTSTPTFSTFPLSVASKQPRQKNMALSDIIDDIDNYKEDSRLFRGRASGFAGATQWRQHRSTRRYFEAVVTSPRSGVLLGLLLEAATIVTIACAVCAWNHVAAGDWGALGGFGAENGFARQHRAEIDPLLLTLTSPALSLLLVFRTNSAYARWWEARGLLGGMVNKSRDIMRHALIWFDRTNGDEATKEYIKEVCAFSVTLKHHLRLPDTPEAKEIYKRELSAELATLNLPGSTIKAIANAPHGPLEVVRRLSRATRCNNDNIRDTSDGSQSINGYGGSGERVADSVIRALDRNLGEYVDQMGACEKIAKTPMPLVYTRHTERFLGIWLATIPFALANKLKDGILIHNDLEIIVGTAFISFFFLGIDELGIQIEEPFTVLPFDSICDGIQKSASALIQCEMGANAENVPVVPVVPPVAVQQNDKVEVTL